MLIYKIEPNGLVSNPPVFLFKELVLNGLTWLKLQSENFKKKEQEVKDDATKKISINTLINKISDIENRSQITTNKALIQSEIKRLKAITLIRKFSPKCQNSFYYQKGKRDSKTR